jgi:RNA polymerase sigma-70 factor (ECF subfamily)
MLPTLNNLALSLTRSQHDAEDLVQMTCEHALMRLTPGQPRDQLLNSMLESMRTIWNGELRGREIEDQHARDERDSPHRLSVHDGEELLDNRAMLQDLEQAIRFLPETERRLLDLVCVQGLSYKNAADITGVPIGTVMSRLARARLHLMEQVKTEKVASEGSIRTLQPCRP